MQARGLGHRGWGCYVSVCFAAVEFVLLFLLSAEEEEKEEPSGE